MKWNQQTRTVLLFAVFLWHMSNNQDVWRTVIKSSFDMFFFMVNTINRQRCSHPFSRGIFLGPPYWCLWHPTLWSNKGKGGKKSKKAQHTKETSCAVHIPRIQTTRKIKKQKSLIGITTKSLTSQLWICCHLWTDFISPACRWKKESGWPVHSFLSIVIFPVLISCAFYALIYIWQILVSVSTYTLASRRNPLYTRRIYIQHISFYNARIECQMGLDRF